MTKMMLLVVKDKKVDTDDDNDCFLKVFSKAISELRLSLLYFTQLEKDSEESSYTGQAK